MHTRNWVYSQASVNPWQLPFSHTSLTWWKTCCLPFLLFGAWSYSCSQSINMILCWLSYLQLLWIQCSAHTHQQRRCCLAASLTHFSCLTILQNTSVLTFNPSLTLGVSSWRQHGNGASNSHLCGVHGWVGTLGHASRETRRQTGESQWGGKEKEESVASPPSISEEAGVKAQAL